MSQEGLSERTVGFIVARLSSSRLSAKQLRRIGHRPSIEWTARRLADCEEIDEVVIATVDEPQNEPLREWAAAAGIECFWYKGEVDHVTSRLVKAAEIYQADLCVLVSGDCPLVSGEGIDATVRALKEHPEGDYVNIPPDANGNPSMLEGIQTARFRSWRLADELANRPEYKEHQFPLLYRRPDLFKRVDAQLPPELYGPHHRLSIDTWADVEFMNALHDKLVPKGKEFDLPDVLDLLMREPGLKEINEHVKQRGLVEEIVKTILVVDGGGEYGFGHLTRSLELALQIVERLSWPAAFVVDDEKAASIVEARGLEVLWGAIGRPARGQSPGYQLWEPSDGEFGLAVVDVSASRNPGPGWRGEVGCDVPTVMLDRADEPAQQADLIIFPGVQGRSAFRAEPSGVQTVEGLDFAILRREVRRAARLESAKDIDLLVYLYDEEWRKKLGSLEGAGYRVKVLDKPAADFPELLARSKFFVSGYGQSFYEAAALGTYPIVQPLSELHLADALAFYSATGLEPVILSEDDDPAGIIGALFDDLPVVAAKVEDGTPKLVELLKELAYQSHTIAEV